MVWTLPTPTESTCQDAVAGLPGWLTGTRLGGILRVIARAVDGLADYVTAAVKFRFPGAYADDSLGLIGQECKIYRGPDELAASYAGRLAISWDTHRAAGGWATTLRQLRAYWTGFTSGGAPWFPWFQAWASTGQVVTLNEDGTLGVTDLAWNWDSHSPGGGGTLYPSRYWIVLYQLDGIFAEVTGMQWGKGATWGDGQKWGDGRAWGTNATPAQAATLTKIILDWNPPHAMCEQLIVVYDRTAWDAAGPDGTWDYWKNRNRAASYFHGTRP